MRPLELFVLGTTLLALIPGRSRSVRLALAAAAGVVALLQAAIEGQRWQLWPVYSVIAVLLVARLAGVALPVAARRAAAGFGAVTVMVSAALGSWMPVYDLPVPSGPHAVGTTHLFFTNTERDDPFAAAGTPRTIWAQVWYPAAPGATGATAPYLPGEGKGLRGAARLIELPRFIFDPVGLLETQARLDVPVLPDERFPTLVFSHGYALGHPAQNAWLMQELASRGYVIFSLAHPGEAALWRTADGSIHSIDRNNPRLASLWAEVTRDGDYDDKLAVATTAAEREAATVEHLADHPLMGESMELWVNDTRFVLDELERLDAGEPATVFAGALDLERVGVFGMSFGGAAAARVCAVDARCKAALNLDGFHYGTALGPPLERPFLMFYSAGNQGMNVGFFSEPRAPLYNVVIRGSTHGHFGEFILQSGFLAWFLTPPDGESIDGWRALEIINTYTIAFFGQYLNGAQSPLLAGEGTPPEVRFSRSGAAGTAEADGAQ